MRLWSFSPGYLLPEDLRQLLRDGLAALRMLERGEAHKMLIRFYAAGDPRQAVCDYLHHVADDAEWRSMTFDRALIPCKRSDAVHLLVSAGQMEHEVWLYGTVMVKKRGQGQAYCDFFAVYEHRPNPVFMVVRGAIEQWEKSPPYDYTKCKKCGDPVEYKTNGKPHTLCEHCRPANRRREILEDNFWFPGRA